MNTSQRTRNPELRFTPSNSELLERFNSVASAQFGEDKTACLEAGLNALNQLEELKAENERLKQNLEELRKENLGLSAATFSKLEDAAKNEGLTTSEALDKAANAWSSRVSTLKETLSNMSDEQLRTTKVKGVAALRIQKAVDDIDTFNKGSEESKDKYFICQTSLFHASGCNLKAVQNYMKEHQTDIDTLNENHGVTDTNSKKPYKFIREDVYGKFR